MRKIIYSALLMVLLVATFAAAKGVEVSADAKAQAGVTPDSIFWGLDTAMENVEVALTFNDDSKAKKRILFAKERLVEAKIMTDMDNFEDAEKARRIHQKHMIALKSMLQMQQSINATQELRSNVEIEQELNSQEKEADSYIKMRIMVKGDLNEEQKSRLIALFESFKNESSSARLSVQQEREKIKIKLRTKESLTEEEVGDIEDEVTTETSSDGSHQEVVASQFIKVSQDAITMAEQKVKTIDNVTIRAEAEAILDSAKALQVEANAAMAKKDYDEARLMAMQARKEARNAIIMSAGKARSNGIHADTAIETSIKVS